jgi:sulfide dehydrogenase cytochrome subunit
MKRTNRWLWLASLALACAGVSAQTTDFQARAWAASCAACHGTGGKSNSAIPSINGQDKQVLLTKLLAYKRDQLQATVMHQHAKGYSDAELERLADHFSRQPK